MMMNKRLLIGFLLIGSFSGMLFSQTLYDSMRKSLLDEKLKPINMLRKALSDKKAELTREVVPFVKKELALEEKALILEKRTLVQAQDTALQKLLDDLDAQEKAITNEIKALKFKSIKLGGKLDFKSDKGTALAFNIEYHWQTWTLFEKIDISPVLSFTLRKNDEATSYEGTGGFRFDFPVLWPRSGPFLRIGLGGQIQTGDKPDACISVIAAGLAIEIYKFITIEPEFVFNIASKAIYAEGTKKTKNDMGLNITIGFNFSNL